MALGHFWQGRFYSCAMDEPHVPAAMAYIELNPVRAGMVRVPWTYRWSSAAAGSRPPSARVFPAAASAVRKEAKTA